MAAATVSSEIPPTLPEPDGYEDAAGFPLNLKCYVADRPNATTARGTTSTNFPIEVTLNAGGRQHLPHLCVHCPSLDLRNSKPKIVATDADLVLLRVAVNPENTFSIHSWDFFVYHPHRRPPRLDLLPNPHPIRFFNPLATALLRGADGDGYAVASLTNRVPIFDAETCAVVSADFDVHLYRSSSSSSNHGAGEGWASRRVPVSEPLRETLTPLPDALADEMLYHETAKAIAVGGARGTVAWVDLWRGLLVCDVLELDERPVLRDVPLPLTARGNRGCLLRQWNPAILRDVAVSRHGDSIKYVEVDTRGDSVDECWKATVYSMPVPVGSWEDWSVDCEVESEDIAVDASDARHSQLLSNLSGRDTTSKLQQLAFPTISMDDDVVCMFSTTSSRKDNLGVVVAVDMRKRELRGVTELNLDEFFHFMPIYCATEVSRCLRKTAGTREALKLAEKEVPIEPTGKKRLNQLKRKCSNQHVTCQSDAWITVTAEPDGSWLTDPGCKDLLFRRMFNYLRKNCQEKVSGLICILSNVIASEHRIYVLVIFLQCSLLNPCISLFVLFI